MTKRTFQLFLVVAILVTSFAATGSAFAGGACANYVTVQWGDTLSSIAALCGTTVEAIQAANPNLGWWLYAGQVLYIPSGYSPAPVPAAGGTYTIQWGDTLGNVAARYGTSLSGLLAVNPQIWNVNLVYPGQVINLPSGGAPSPAYYPPPPPSPAYVSDYSVLKITAGYGLMVRTGPGKNYAEIHSQYVSAVYCTNWRYRRSSLTIDPTGAAWIEVTLDPRVVGYTTGWIMVRDGAWNYFTDPQIP